MDNFRYSSPGTLPSSGLIKLRDLPHNLWNVDTLTPDAGSAWQLAEIAEEWAGMVEVFDDPGNVQTALGNTYSKRAIVSVWWD